MMGIDHTVGATDQRFAEPVHAKGVEMVEAAIASLEERLRHVSDEVNPPLLKRELDYWHARQASMRTSVRELRP
jgi:hypothetical protein